MMCFVVALLASAAVQAAEKPNVLFIAIDDLRPELGCYAKAQPHIARQLIAQLRSQFRTTNSR